MAKNCDVSIKCSECESDRHLAALHPGPVPWHSGSTPPSLHGREEEESCGGDVSSKCTKICGKGFSENSCSKLCLVNVYPAGSPDQGRRIYTIIDEQSNRSLARSEFFDMFKRARNFCAIHIKDVCRSSLSNWKKSSRVHR